MTLGTAISERLPAGAVVAGLVAILGTMSAPVAAIECDNIDLAGTRSIEIDRHHLIRTRWLQGQPDSGEVRLSGLISSRTESITFARGDGNGRYRVVLHSLDGTSHVTGWISDGQRDGICAIELAASRGERTVSDFLQILAIYPGGELALGLPNRTDRIGLIMLGGAFHPHPTDSAAYGPGPTRH